MMLHEARALITALSRNHLSAGFYDLLRVNEGFSVTVVTFVSIVTIGKWFEQEGLLVRQMEARGVEKWRVWFRESISIKE